MHTNIQIVLVSAQAAPNLLPAVDPSLKPKETILLVTHTMRHRADALEKVFKENGIKTSRIPITNEHDYTELENTLLNLATERDGEGIALNVTGGTKLMALAAQSIAQQAGWPVFYVDMDTDEVIWIVGNEQKRHRLTDHLRLRHYLMGYGFEIVGTLERPQLSAPMTRLIDTLILQIGSLEQPLAQLNWLGQLAEDKKRLSVEMDDRQRESIGLANLLRHFEDAGVLAVKGSTLHFHDESQLVFAKGGWLEHYVFQTVASLTERLGIRDKAANLKVTSADGAQTELDVAFIARNRLFTIECKTARMDKPEAPKANDALFKLSDKTRIGGLATRRLLVSYRALREAEKNLAKALDIHLVCGPELARLAEKIKHWALA